MIRAEHHRQFQEALLEEDVGTRLKELASSLRNEGVAQIDLYLLFSFYQEKTSINDPRYDAILDVMDIIYGGPWAKGRDLYEKPLNENMIRSAREQDP